MSNPQKIDTRQDELFRQRLSTQLNPKHPLFMLAGSIDWQGLEANFASLYQAELGYPPRPIRLMVELMMLQHMEVYPMNRWSENGLRILTINTFVAM